MNTLDNTAILERYRFLQAIVRCPVSKSPLRLVGIDDLLSRLPGAQRERVREGTIGAFISESANRAYPLTDKVVNFLEQDSILIDSPGIPGSIAPASAVDDIKQSVKAWYDQFGWKKNDSGLYNDSALFSQDKPEGHGLYELMSHLSIIDRLPGGAFVLDAASGAVAHPEYLAFSWFYKSRVCVDMSETALNEANGKLRQSDFCCLADICNLPFRDDTFEGAVSGYTIQHIPESQQFAAIKELYRVIQTNTHLCILTDVPYSSVGEYLRFLLKVIRKLLKLAGVIKPLPAPQDSNKDSPPHLYCHLQSYAWWKDVASSLTRSYSIESLRMLSKPDFDSTFGKSNHAAYMLRAIESVFPKLTAHVSHYCIVAMRKTAL